MAEPASVDAYLAALPADQRDALERLRQAIRAAAPQATEGIAYGMPAFRQDGRFLVSFAAFREHCSLFPASGAVVDALGGRLRGRLSGKGTIRFRVDDPLPADVVARIVEVRLAETARDR